MTSPVTSGSDTYTPISSVLNQQNTQSATSGGSNLDQEAFLKLLVAQLKYQDPMTPADGTEFLSQTAQFTQVEKLNELAKSQQAMLSAQQMISASSLVGRTVTYLDTDGSQRTGVVTSASLGGGDPIVKVNGVPVPLSSVNEVNASTPGTAG